MELILEGREFLEDFLTLTPRQEVLPALSKFYDVASKSWLQSTTVQGVKLEMPPILHATTCDAPPSY